MQSINPTFQSILLSITLVLATEDIQDNIVASCEPHSHSNTTYEEPEILSEFKADIVTKNIVAIAMETISLLWEGSIYTCGLSSMNTDFTDPKKLQVKDL